MLLLERLDPSGPLEPHGPELPMWTHLPTHLPMWTLSCTSSHSSIRTLGPHDDQDPTGRAESRPKNRSPTRPHTRLRGLFCEHPLDHADYYGSDPQIVGDSWLVLDLSLGFGSRIPPPLHLSTVDPPTLDSNPKRVGRYNSTILPAFQETVEQRLVERVAECPQP